MNKRLLSLACSLAITVGLFAQTVTQRGVSYQYNGKQKRTPLGGVTISYDGNRRTVLSDGCNGTFSLILEKRKMGDRIGQVTIKKREMMVFNQHAVDEWNVRKEPLCLILCDCEEFERHKREYMELGRRDARQRYDRQKANLEKQLEEGKIKLDEKEKALNEAYDKLERLQKEIEQYSDDLARIDLSELDSEMQVILEMYQQGATEEAIDKLKSLRLAEEFDKETAHNETVRHELARSEGNLQILIEKMKNSVTMLKNSGEWEEAGKYLKRIADRLNTYDAIYEYACFCDKQNMLDEAEIYYRKALEVPIPADGVYNRFAVVQVLGDVLREKKDFEEAEQLLYELSDSLRRLCLKEENLKPVFASTLNAIGNLNENMRKWEPAIDAFREALHIYKNLSSVDSLRYTLEQARVLNNMALVFFRKGMPESSVKYYEEARKIWERGLKDHPLNENYQCQYAGLLYNMANAYKYLGLDTQCRYCFQESISRFEKLAQNNADAYQHYIALVATDYGTYWLKLETYDASEKYLLKALRMYQKMGADSVWKHMDDYSRTLIQLGTLYNIKKDYSNSEECLLKACILRERLAQRYPQVYTHILWYSRTRLIRLYRDWHQFEKAVPIADEMLAYRRKENDQHRDENGRQLADALDELSGLYAEMEDYEKSIVYEQEAIGIVRKAYDQSYAFKETLARLFYNLAWTFSKAQMTDDAKNAYEESMEEYYRIFDGCSESILREMWKIDLNVRALNLSPQDYVKVDSLFQLAVDRYGASIGQDEIRKTSYAQLLGNHSYRCIYMKEYYRSEQYARDALSVDSTKHVIYTNLAAALLFQGKTAEADKMYRQYKSELKDAFLDDFKQFEEAGAIPEERKKDVERIKQMLNE